MDHDEHANVQPWPWPSAAPDVVISALMLMSSRCAPVGSAEPHCTWTVTGVHFAIDNGPEDEPALIGDLSVSDGHWRVSVSCLAAFTTRGEIRKRWLVDRDTAAFAEIYAPWASHAMWDFVAAQAKTVTAPTFADLDIPRVTPALEVYRPELRKKTPRKVSGRAPRKGSARPR